MEIEISDAEFNLFQRLIYDASGIFLTPVKKELLKSRLIKRVREHSLHSFKEYYHYVTERDPSGEELISVLDCISTNLTEFFREIAHFEFLSDHLIPSLIESKKKKHDKKIRVWSAGCSTGEEPFTLAMVLSESIPSLFDWDVKILATDISTRVLRKSMLGIYPKERLKGIPPHLLNTYFERENSSSKENYQVKQILRNMISFRRLNLMDDIFPFKGKFDFVFCRNVMIYFDKKTQGELVSKYYNHLAPQGYLFIGHSESLAGTDNKFKYVQPTIYQK
ncbi:MAG: cheR [Candidatus Brocadiaceae bacterium]|nr:cheR [Candidatus Brocadiaceae bacterium]